MQRVQVQFKCPVCKDSAKVSCWKPAIMRHTYARHVCAVCECLFSVILLKPTGQQSKFSVSILPELLEISDKALSDFPELFVKASEVTPAQAAEVPG